MSNLRWRFFEYMLNAVAWAFRYDLTHFETYDLLHKRTDG